MKNETRQAIIEDVAWTLADKRSDPRVYTAVLTLLRRGRTDRAARFVGLVHRNLVKGQQP